jgi:protein O-GlcNAc transferase
MAGGLADMLKQGFELIQAKQWDEARAVLEWALAGTPKNLDAHAMLGFIAAAQKRWGDAAGHYETAAELKGNNAELYMSAGESWFEAGEWERAADWLTRAVELDSGLLQARFSLGKALCFADRNMEAVEAFKGCVALGKKDAEVLAWTAQAVLNTGHADQAVGLARGALGLAPDQVQLAELLAKVSNYSSVASAEEIFEAHKEYGRLLEVAVQGAVRPEIRVGRGPRPAKLRVGLISGDMRGHAMSFLTLGLAENLDRGRYELACYYSAKKEDRFTKAYEDVSVVFRRIARMNAEAVARQIADDGVHVLIDLAGLTAGTGVPVMALRPAPVQMTYLGYPNTTGVRAIDWRVVDAITDPPGYERLSVEKLARVETCFLAFRPVLEMPEPGPPPCLKNGYVTFGAFSALQKYNDGLIGMWAKVLEAAPGSRLLLKSLGFKQEAAREAMRQRFARAGLADISRVLVEGPTAGAEEMLPQYERVDISLDTFPYNGTTTICESFYMGVPLVSRAGDRSAARVGLSLLTAVGLAELCTNDEAGYVKIAADLAGDVARLTALRRGLRERFRRTLGDEAGFTRRFERVIESAWRERV